MVVAIVHQVGADAGFRCRITITQPLFYASDKKYAVGQGVSIGNPLASPINNLLVEQGADRSKLFAGFVQCVCFLLLIKPDAAAG